MEKNEILKSFKNLEGNGRKLVEVKRVAPAFSKDLGKYIPDVDTLDFNNERIYANIPCWQDDKGNLTSIRTGKPVKRISRLDQVCEAGFGSAFDYDDVHIIYTRRWLPGQRQPEYFFAVRKCRDCEVVHHRAFGEHLTEPPRIEM